MKRVRNLIAYEYNSCDFDKLLSLLCQVKYTQGKAVLFTNDGPWMLKCGKIPNVLATMDFGASDNDKIDEYWNTYLRAVEPKGPLVNAEYYPGWLTHWQESMQRVPIDPILKSLEKQILDGANVNFYMFYGGTNFGFTAGANDGGPGSYNSDVTSYDYDAPMDESGQPTEKYYAIKNLISKYFPIPNIPLPDIIPKVKYGDVSMKPRAFMLDTLGRQHLSTYTVKSINTKTFEALNQNSGFVLYETILPKTTRDPASLKISGIKDRAYVYVDGQFVGVLSRENKIYSLPISLNSGSQLQILVENEGRINYGIANDFKGIVSSVYYDSLVLVNWTMTGFPLENHELMDALLAVMSKRSGNSKLTGMNNRSYLKSGPTIFTGEFEVKEDSFGDTYLGKDKFFAIYKEL
jgi:beta-galactosidase